MNPALQLGNLRPLRVSKWPSSHHRPGLELPNPGHTYLQHLLPPPLSKKPSRGCICGCPFWLPLWKMAPPKSPCQGGQQGKVNGQDWGDSYPESHPSDYFQLGFIDLLGLKEAAFFLFHYICMCETSCCFCIRALQTHEHLLELSLCARQRTCEGWGVTCELQHGAGCPTALVGCPSRGRSHTSLSGSSAAASSLLGGRAQDTPVLAAVSRV